MSCAHLLGTLLSIALSSPSSGDGICVPERLVIRGTIRGLVMLRTEGRTHPLPNATVELRQDTYGRPLLKTVTTALDGTFSFPDTGPGSYSVRVQHSGITALSVGLFVKKANPGAELKQLRIVLGNDPTQHCSGSTAQLVMESERD